MAETDTKAEALQFVRQRLQEGDTQFQVAAASFSLHGQSVSLIELATIWSAVTPFSIPTLNTALTHEAFQIVRREQAKLLAQNEAYEALPRDDTELRKYLRLLQRPNTPRDHHEASVFVMKQWMWQVKQAIAKRKPRWQVCPIFWSREQGTGKSFNVLRILEPIKVFTRHLFVDALDDNFSGKMLANTYAAFLDEFAGAENINTAKLKAFMSGKEIQQRGMHSSFGVAVENRISFIATSNEEPPHGLEDVTGARRLWSIHCNGKSMQRDTARREAFDSLNVGRIWAAVRTNDPCPHEAASDALLRFMDEVREDNLRAKSSLEGFVDEMCTRRDDAPPLLLKEFREAATRYAWETKQPAIKGSYEKFATALANMGVKVVRPKGYWYVHGIHIRDPEAA